MSRTPRQVESTRHINDIPSISLPFIEKLFDQTQKVKADVHAWGESLKGQTVALLFWEVSTRTRASFEIAVERLGGKSLYLHAQSSSEKKGESEQDTLRTLYSMGVRIFVVRHPKAFVAATLSTLLPQDACVINAGDGDNEHPTQALLDVFTLIERGELKDQRVLVIGDIRHSRVAHSDLELLKKFEAHCMVSGPDELMPVDLKGVERAQNLDEGISIADVIMPLRVQDERFGQELSFAPDQYFTEYGLTQERFEKAKESAVIMHPGPFRRNFEIASELIDHPRSLIWKQVENGVHVRMALLSLLMEGIQI